jgi:hypothetical protein
MMNDELKTTAFHSSFIIHHSSFVFILFILSIPVNFSFADFASTLLNDTRSLPLAVLYRCAPCDDSLSLKVSATKTKRAVFTV